MNPLLSIIYVYFNTPQEIEQSIESLKLALKSVLYEIIIVDNASEKKLPEDIYSLINAKIIKNNKNCGYGKGLNQGAKIASGKYLLLANPDVEFEKNSISKLLSKINNNPKIGIVGPQLKDEKGKILQSISGIPTLLQSLFVFSFISKIWTDNPFYRKYHNLNLDRNKEQNVDVVSGACMMVRKLAFDKVGGFDDKFFMYFEEADFCFRVRKIGYKVTYYPQAKVLHLVGRSSQNKEWIEKTFEQSRFKFFKKYYGLTLALFEELILRFMKPANILLLVILAFSVFLNLYRLSERMIFIGDQGWFYLSARDMLINGQIPLIGIASSHPWLHQGPLWTYTMAVVLWIFRFNPVSGGYFTASLSAITVFFIYKFGKEIFSKRVGLISALLYTTSPLVLINTQMPYHTSPIPLLTLGLIYAVYKWIKGYTYFFPIIILLMAMLYNFELATQIFWFPIGLIFVTGLLRKNKWADAVLKTKTLFISLVLFILPMLPILIYDINHKFAQTIKFFVWIPYSVINRLLAVKADFLVDLDKPFISMLSFFGNNYKNLIFISNFKISLLIMSLCVGYFIYLLVTNRGKKDFFSSINTLLIFIVIPLIGIFINMTPSGAYLPIFFPSVIIFTAWIFNMIMNKKYLFFPILLLIFFIVITNSLFYLNNSESRQAYGLYFSKRLDIVSTILKKAGKENYNIKGKGPGSQFASFTMNYEYLAWWLGHSPEKSPQRLKFTIQENKNGIFLTQNE